jgi:hypothetical protein
MRELTRTSVLADVLIAAFAGCVALVAKAEGPQSPVVFINDFDVLEGRTWAS